MTNFLKTRLNQTARWMVAELNVLRTSQDGQDLIEYALMAAAIAIAVAAIFPNSIAPNISTIFSKVNSSLGSANN
ncbi:MAG: Flp family type IVb pilin [Acidobacteria bacterium]|nr:Flp family type IVb pilin [Acidobacteriota bacterium]